MILIALFIWFIIEFVFFIFHRKPLNEQEILELSNKRTRKYIKKNYSFNNVSVNINKQFKSSLRSRGAWYNVEEKLSTFPSYVAALLKGKKHEWVVLAIEKDGIVHGFYANKGEDKSSVSFNCGLEYIIEKCKENNCTTIMRFHNHPNNNPNYQTCLLASQQDKNSASWCSKQVVHSYNWLDFVCERGKFIKFFEKYSPSFLPENANTEHIQSENNLSSFKNYKLHRELGLIHYNKGSKNEQSQNVCEEKVFDADSEKITMRKNIILTIIFCVSLCLGICVMLGHNGVKEGNNVSSITSKVSETYDNREMSKPQEEKEVIDISSDIYYDLIKQTFSEAAQANGYFEFAGGNTYRTPYIQLYITPKDKYSDDITKTQATKLIEDVLGQLRKYNYKSGGFLKKECEYINVYFYGFDDNGSYHRNGGPFIQINIFDIQNTTIDGLVY